MNYHVNNDNSAKDNEEDNDDEQSDNSSFTFSGQNNINNESTTDFQEYEDPFETFTNQIQYERLKKSPSAQNYFEDLNETLLRKSSYNNIARFSGPSLEFSDPFIK